MDEYMINPEQPINADRVKEINITKEMKTSFLSYAMSVIVSRALPDVRDGLKPVHRRILYGMDELSLYPDKSYKKSARIVGDVMGKYHPHGDSAIYDSMVRMAQPFSYRYPLVNGHGNFGSVDGDGAAAMRYTEAKMEKITVEMLKDLKKDTVDFIDNYDGTESEPKVLPSRIPNLLVNGASGIAVGMATNIPPHNLGEVIDGYVAYIRNKEIELPELMQHIPGPDFPTGGIIIGLSGIRQAYETGRGIIRVKAKTEINAMKNGKQQIIVTEIPYQVNKTTLIDRIATLAKEKKVDGITDLRDESNRKGMRIIIELRRDVNAEVVLNNLYKNSQLQVSFGINMLALVNDKPEVLSLLDTIKHYYNHQIDVLLRKTRYDLEKAKNREHILKGFIIALDHIDEVIKVIRESYDDTEEQLMSRFELDQDQTKAILSMQLKRLSGLEYEKINDELRELVASIEYFNRILKDEVLRDEILTEGALEVKQKYDNERRSYIDPNGIYDIEDEDLIPVEDVMIAVTTNGYVKRMNIDTYRAQNRGGRGKTGMKMNEDDVIDTLIYTSTHDYLLFFTTLGRVYKLKGYNIPAYGRNSKGLPIVNLLDLNNEEAPATVMHIEDFKQGNLFFTTEKGTVKRTKVSDFQHIRANGIRAISLKDNDTLHSVRLTDGEREMILGASNGKAIRFDEKDVRTMGRTAAGVRGMRFGDKDSIVGATVITPERSEILSVTENGYGKRTDVNEYRLQNRGGKGVKTIHITEKNGPLSKLVSVKGDEDILVVTDKGMIIRVPVDQIAALRRDTQGVKIINLLEDHHVSTLALVDVDEDDEDMGGDADGGDETTPGASNDDETQSTDSLTEAEESKNKDGDDEDEIIEDLLSESY